METKELIMSDEETTEPVEENSAIKQMRKAIDSEKAENADLRGKILATYLKDIDLEVGRGLGKAIAAGYDGELTTEAVSAFAKSEYDYEMTVQQAPQAQEMQAAQQRADTFGQASAPIQPVSGEDIIRGHDQRLGQPDATRQDAQNALEAKVQHYLQ